MALNFPFISRVLTFFLILLFVSEVHAFAEEIPEEALMVDYTNCMTGCSEFEGPLGCEVLCGCTVERFKVALNEETYNLLQDQLGKDEISPENRAFLDETANLCVAEMDRIMAEFFLDVPEEEDLLLPPPLEDDDGE